jgi:glycosyltransferase involved in cell wall biosynthesis
MKINNNKIKKILYIVSTLKESGPTNQLSYIVKFLDRKKFQPQILTLSSESNNSMIGHFTTNLNIKVDSLDLSRIQGMLYAKSKISQYLKRNSIDIVHTQGIRADGLIKDIKIPSVTTLRNYPHNDYPSKFGRLKGCLMVWSHMRSIKSNKDNCIACSKSIAYDFLSNDIKLKYIQNGVDIEKYYPLLYKDKLKLRGGKGVNSESRVYITVGGLIPRKNVKTIILSFNLLNNKDSCLLIVGDGAEKDDLKSISTENVIFVGNVSNVVEYLQISDCFISASLAEGLPNTVLEAIACGLPTILSDIPPHKELGNNSMQFFQAHDVAELSNSMKAIPDFKSKDMVEFKKQFNAESMSKKYQSVYLEKYYE